MSVRKRKATATTTPTTITKEQKIPLDVVVDVVVDVGSEKKSDNDHDIDNDYESAARSVSPLNSLPSRTHRQRTELTYSPPAQQT